MGIGSFSSEPGNVSFIAWYKTVNSRRYFVTSLCNDNTILFISS